jgi:hypothetical protein
MRAAIQFVCSLAQLRSSFSSSSTKGERVGEIAAKAVVQLLFTRKASPWSTQVQEAETHSSIVSNPYAVVRALQTTVMARQVYANNRFEMHTRRPRRHPSSSVVPQNPVEIGCGPGCEPLRKNCSDEYMNRSRYPERICGKSRSCSATKRPARTIRTTLPFAEAYLHSALRILALLRIDRRFWRQFRSITERRRSTPSPWNRHIFGKIICPPLQKSFFAISSKRSDSKMTCDSV